MPNPPICAFEVHLDAIFSDPTSEYLQDGKYDLNAIATDYIASCPDDPSCYMDGDFITINDVGFHPIHYNQAVSISALRIQFINCELPLKDSSIDSCSFNNCDTIFRSSNVVNSFVDSPNCTLGPDTTTSNCSFFSSSQLIARDSGFNNTTFNMTSANADSVISFDNSTLNGTILVEQGDLQVSSCTINGSFIHAASKYLGSTAELTDCTFTAEGMLGLSNNFTGKECTFTTKVKVESVLPKISLHVNTYGPLIKLMNLAGRNNTLTLTDTTLVAPEGQRVNLNFLEFFEITDGSFNNTIFDSNAMFLGMRNSNISNSSLPFGIAGNTWTNVTFNTCSFNTGQTITQPGPCTAVFMGTDGTPAEITGNTFINCIGPINVENVFYDNQPESPGVMSTVDGVACDYASGTDICAWNLPEIACANNTVIPDIPDIPETSVNSYSGELSSIQSTALALSSPLLIAAGAGAVLIFLGVALGASCTISAYRNRSNPGSVCGSLFNMGSRREASEEGTPLQDIPTNRSARTINHS